VIQELIAAIEEKDIMSECKTKGSYAKLYELSEQELLDLMASKTNDPQLILEIMDRVKDLPPVAAKTTFI